jgi:hypothetical protein
MAKGIVGPRYSIPPLWKLSHNLKNIPLRRAEKQAEVFFISFPKSGRSWIRVMLGKYLCDQFHLPERYLANSFRLTLKAGLPRTLFIHDNQSYLDIQLKRDKSRFKGKKVIFFTRNIKDTLVSLYFHSSRRLGLFEGEISEFLWKEYSPVLFYLVYHNTWYQNREVPRAFLHLTYEGTQADPQGTLASILEFIGVRKIDQDILESAVAYASFDNMQALQKRRGTRDSRFKPGDPNDQESYKTRRGVVGGYVDYLNQRDIELIDVLAQKLGSPFVQV